MNASAELVNRLWRLYAVLRKDGITYQQYVTELTYLLFLKMASEQKDESRIPEQYRWSALKSAPRASKCVAKLCRRACGVNVSGKPSRRRAAATARRTRSGLSAPPLAPTNSGTWPCSG